MKGKQILVFGLLLFFGFTAINCYAQSSNNEQRLVGTWIQEGPGSSNGTIWVFKSDGTLSIGDVNTLKYVATVTVLYWYRTDTDFASTREYTFSADGRTLILINTSNGTTSAVLLRRRA